MLFLCFCLFCFGSLEFFFFSLKEKRMASNKMIFLLCSFFLLFYVFIFIPVVSITTVASVVVLVLCQFLYCGLCSTEYYTVKVSFFFLISSSVYLYFNYSGGVYWESKQKTQRLS